jgi:hypothetical protein
MRKYATLVKVTEVALRSEEGNPCWSLWYSLCITLHRRADSIRMSVRRGRPWTQGVPPGDGVRRPAWMLTASGRPAWRGVEQSTKTLTHPMKGRTTVSEALNQMRHRQKRRRPHEGKKAFIRAARRPSKLAQPAKVLGRTKSRAAVLMVKQLLRPPT